MRAITILLIMSVMGCCTNHKGSQSNLTVKSDSVASFIPGPPALVYKTKGDYYNLVPVLLSEDKSQIIAYPYPGDLKTDRGYTLPDSLHDGYMLDNRGIGIRVAFLGITYEEYANLQEVPTAAELYEKIIDKDPLVELCDCGLKSNYPDLVNHLNLMIDSGQIRIKCKMVVGKEKGERREEK